MITEDLENLEKEMNQIEFKEVWILDSIPDVTRAGELNVMHFNLPTLNKSFPWLTESPKLEAHNKDTTDIFCVGLGAFQEIKDFCYENHIPTYLIYDDGKRSREIKELTWVQREIEFLLQKATHIWQQK